MRWDEWPWEHSVCYVHLLWFSATIAGPLTIKGNQCEHAEANSTDTAIIVSDKFGYGVRERKVESNVRERAEWTWTNLKMRSRSQLQIPSCSLCLHWFVGEWDLCLSPQFTYNCTHCDPLITSPRPSWSHLSALPRYLELSLYTNVGGREKKGRGCEGKKKEQAGIKNAWCISE